MVRAKSSAEIENFNVYSSLFPLMQYLTRIIECIYEFFIILLEIKSTLFSCLVSLVDLCMDVFFLLIYAFYMKIMKKFISIKNHNFFKTFNKFIQLKN